MWAKLVTQLMTNIFPWMALSGLLLAAWGLLYTPDEIQEGQELQLPLHRAPPQ